MIQEFGDIRTVEKLDIVEGYVQLYIRVLSGGSFRPQKHYIDAFAGEGDFRLGDTDEPVSGSVKRIGKLEFENFHFIEKDKRKCDRLAKVVDNLGIKSKTHIYPGDANEELPKIINRLESKDRALVFIDPFGMQLKWDTLEQISRVKYCDIVYLFPCNSILRAAPIKSKGILLEDMKEATCDCLGMSEQEITTAFYSESRQPDLLDGSVLERNVNYDKVERLVLSRLKGLFKYVFEKPYRLQLDGKPTLFSIFLMTTNPSDNAQKAIKRLGKHVFRDDQPIQH